VRQSKTPTKRYNNPYVKDTRDTCHWCNENGHIKFCPSRRVVVVVEVKEGEEEIEKPTIEKDEYVEAEFAEEEPDERVTLKGNARNCLNTLLCQEQNVQFDRGYWKYGESGV